MTRSSTPLPRRILMPNGSKRTQIVLEDMDFAVHPRSPRSDVTLLDRQQAFGYSQEDSSLSAAADGGDRPGSSRLDGHRYADFGAIDAVKAALTDTYFKQHFAQVTNPPIDPIREELVMSLVSFIGPRPNILDHEGNAKKKRLEVRQPILTNGDLEKIRSIAHFEEAFDTKTLNITYPSERGAKGMDEALTKLCERAEHAVNSGFNIIILSDRMTGPDRIPIPALLATAAVHHHLILAKVFAPLSASSSKPATRGRSTTSRCSQAMGRKRSIPTSPSRRSP